MVAVAPVRQEPQVISRSCDRAISQLEHSRRRPSGHWRSARQSATGPRSRTGAAASDRPTDQTASSGWTTTSCSLDGPLTQLYFESADRNSYYGVRRAQRTTSSLPCMW